MFVLRQLSKDRDSCGSFVSELSEPVDCPPTEAGAAILGLAYQVGEKLDAVFVRGTLESSLYSVLRAGANSETESVFFPELLGVHRSSVTVTDQEREDPREVFSFSNLMDLTPQASDPLASIDEFVKQVGAVRENLLRVVLHQSDVVDLLLISCLCDGHSLLVGVPGLAKTLLVKSLARLSTWKFKRIQFTPDLMPADITGYELLAGASGVPASGQAVTLAYRPGPIFANLILADEINRAPPKTQAALLEAMQERHVTVGGKTYPLEAPFLVVATQNPIEQEGTYPLPEAQLDRFLMEIRMSYPAPQHEEHIVGLTTGEGLPELDTVLGLEAFVSLQEFVRKVPAPASVVSYAVALAVATRPGVPEASQTAKTYVEWGAGPRAAQALVLAAKARALLAGRPAPVAADVEALALPVLRHRVIPNYRAVGEGWTSEGIVKKILADVPKPYER